MYCFIWEQFINCSRIIVALLIGYLAIIYLQYLPQIDLKHTLTTIDLWYEILHKSKDNDLQPIAALTHWCSIPILVDDRLQREV